MSTQEFTENKQLGSEDMSGMHKKFKIMGVKLKKTCETTVLNIERVYSHINQHPNIKNG